MEISTRRWHAVRLVVGVVLLAPIAVFGASRLVDGDGAPERAAAGASAAPGPTPSASTAPAGCPESGLTVWVRGTNAAMGLRVQGFEVVNCGTVPRTLTGYPVLRVLDEARAPLDVQVRDGSAGIAGVPRFDATPTAVTVRPGERASSAIIWRNTYADISAPPAVGHYLAVTLAPGTEPQVVAADGTIDLGSTGRLGVAPWAALPR